MQAKLHDRCATSFVGLYVFSKVWLFYYPTCGYRNTVDFHSQRLLIIKFSRLEFDKSRPGKTHKTMFNNILRPTISVKDLKNKRKHKLAILKSSVFRVAKHISPLNQFSFTFYSKCRQIFSFTTKKRYFVSFPLFYHPFFLPF